MMGTHKTKEEYINIFKNDSRKFQNVLEFSLLRPNDSIAIYGKEEAKIRTEAVEEYLEKEYKDTELYKYYYEMKSCPTHNFNDFERWKVWGCQPRYKKED